MYVCIICIIYIHTHGINHIFSDLGKTIDMSIYQSGEYALELLEENWLIPPSILISLSSVFLLFAIRPRL